MVEISNLEDVLACEVREGDRIVLHGENGSYLVVSMLDHPATGMVAWTMKHNDAKPTPAAFYAAHKMQRVVK